MSWYGNYNQASKQLDALIDKKPNLEQLLSYNDFIPQLKAFNPKLLDYITNSKDIPSQIINLISVAPTQQDNSDRQYKFPLLTIEMIETQTTCIINSLLKQTQNKNQNYLLLSFQLFNHPTVLPLLAGYFVRVQEVMLRARYRQTVQTIYKHPQTFDMMLRHCQHQAVATCLQLYLNLQLSKQQYTSQQKTGIKIEILKKILTKIDEERKKQNQNSVIIIQNLIAILNETIDKYYLIADGKFMLEVILQHNTVTMILQMISKYSQFSYSAMQLCLFMMKYYSFSSFNTEEQNEEINRKNMERLESQPLIIALCNNFGNLLKQIRNTPSITLYHYKLLEVLSHCLALSSFRILTTIKQAAFYPTIIDLLFKHPDCTILHKLVQRSFSHVFETKKRIYELYKKYLFCEISIIQLTGKRLIDTYPQGFMKARKKGFFGILIKIIKIYSGIQTHDQDVRLAITSKAQIWNRLGKSIMKPYQSLIKEDLGNFSSIPSAKQIEFSVKKNLQVTPNMINNSRVIEEIKREETMQNLKSLEANGIEKKQEKPIVNQANKIEDDTFFKVPIEESLERKNSSNDKQKQEQKTQEENLQQEKNQNSEHQKEGFQQFLVRRKQETGEELKIQRSQSSERKFSVGKKTRIASPSPNRKKNSWKQEDEQKKQEKPKPRIQFTKDLPKIPTGPKLTQSALVGEKTENSNQENDLITRSLSDLEELRRITVIKVAGPEQKKYRKIQQEDKKLLGYLGINI